MASGNLASENNDDEMITTINITPLVDVMLVLLVMFMITAPVIYQAGMKVELPKAKSADKTESITLRFILTKDGKIMQGSNALAKDQIPPVIKQALAKDPQAAAVISADRGLPHGSVIEFMDLLKTNGITKFAIGVSKR